MLGAVLSALGGVAGALGSLPGGLSKTSTSLLSPAQQYMNLQMMGAVSPYMNKHFAKLAELGNAPQSAYSSPPFAAEYLKKVQIPARQRQTDMSRNLGDPWHTRSRDTLRQQFKTVSNIGQKQLRNALMLRDLGLQTQYDDTALNRQLGALSGMSGTWMTPMGQGRENYMTAPFDYGSAIAGGMAGIKGIGGLFSNMSEAGKTRGFWGNLGSTTR